MATKRLPIVGQDQGNWGQILNSHISQLHNPTIGGINTVQDVQELVTNLLADDVGKTFLNTSTGNLHQWSGTEWTVLNQTIFNVKDYGAKGDYVTDDTQAIQNTVNAAQSKGGVVFIPNGYYKITQPITISAPVSIKGASRGGAKIDSNVSKTFIVNGVNGVSFEEFTITSLNNSTVFEINGRQFLLSNIHILGKFQKAIHCIDVWDSHFQDIVIITRDSSSFYIQYGYGIYADYSVNNSVDGCKFFGCDTSIFFSYTIAPNTSSIPNHYCEGWMISNSILMLCNYAFVSESSYHISIIGCILDYIGSIAVWIKRGHTSIVSGCWIANTQHTYNNNNGQPFVGIMIESGVLGAQITQNGIQSAYPNTFIFNIAGSYCTFGYNFTSSTGYQPSVLSGTYNMIVGNSGYTTVLDSGVYNTIFDYNKVSIKTQEFQVQASSFNLATVPEFSDNTSAINGGLSVGDMYRSGDNLKIVHS